DFCRPGNSAHETCLLPSASAVAAACRNRQGYAKQHCNSERMGGHARYWQVVLAVQVPVDVPSSKFPVIAVPSVDKVPFAVPASVAFGGTLSRTIKLIARPFSVPNSVLNPCVEFLMPVTRVSVTTTLSAP